MKVAVGWTIHFQTSGCSQKSLGKPAKSTRDTRHSDHGPRNLARESSTSGVTSTKHHDDDDDDAQRRWRWHVCHDFMWFWGSICKLLLCSLQPYNVKKLPSLLPSLTYFGKSHKWAPRRALTRAQLGERNGWWVETSSFCSLGPRALSINSWREVGC